MRKIKACIFDLDGVIVDTAKYHFIAWKEIADKLDFTFTEEHNELLKGVSRMRSLDILLDIGQIEMSDEDKQVLAELKNNRYVSYIQQMTPDEILPGVPDFLKGIKAEGIKIALGSASKNAPLILEKTGITNFFDAVIDGNHVSKAKPDPEVFLKGAEALSANPSECVVFEDAIAGIEAALAGGMKCVGIGDQETLKKANYVIPGFKDFTVEKLYEQFC